jgi:hypothetical protein
MTQITKSLRTDIEVLSANGLSTFIDVNDGVPKWKDTNGFIEPISNYVRASVGLYSQTAQSTPITNTTTPTSLINGGVGSLSVPANGFQVGDSFVAKFSGEISSLNNATIEIHISSNGVTLADTGIITLVTTTNKIWDMEIDFTIRTVGGSGVASVATTGRFNYNKNSNNLAENVGFFSTNNTTFDTTIANTLVVTAQWGSASTSNSIATELFNLYRVY